MEINTNISSGIEMPKQQQAPKSDAPKSDAPKSDAPKSDAPKSDAPKSESVASQNTQDVAKEIKEQSDEQDVKNLKAELRKLTEELNREINPLNTNIKFGFSDQIESMYVNVIDTKEDRVIRKIPSDEAIKLMEKMREIVGIIFDKKG